ncbi:hypothetical protein [Leptolyngbya sp. FACHB-711]|uniref:hypothetical protein n=1 Tax=unclassified Leptolyngbya TaxID=2650499 RepID=UPI001687E5D1|nr:hypothetical protein [Leptolyngbya sp. FACHB-711]MBD1853667.1 hypothetical protein [Cyanobacteria bacterium FACHB-502]MBD2027915.1 hypothetical protein [Leptolyngbya sp. FACHB-711]
MTASEFPWQMTRLQQQHGDSDILKPGFESDPGNHRITRRLRRSAFQTSACSAARP